jgi:hypothetical protein
MPKKVKITSFFLTVLAVGLLFFPGDKKISANADHKFTGWSWSSNAGWTSFNCVNDSSCATSDYGVDLSDSPENKNLSGYAWNSNVGWISFQESDTPPDDYAFAANCSGVCDSAANCTACLDRETGKIWGWAKILSLGDDGWLKLRDEEAEEPYGVYVDLSSSNGEMAGWAWNGNSDGAGIGWMNFNCSDTSSCGDSSYNVALNGVHFPTVDNLAAPNWSYEDACVTAKGIVLTWDMEDADEPSDNQSAYQVIINDQNTRNNPLIDTGKKISPSEQYATTSQLLDYSTSYYWWVRVWDSLGFSSDWQQFYTGAGSSTLTDNIAANLAESPNPEYTFTTYKNEFPNVVFDYIPSEILANQVATFTDASLVYSDSAPADPVSCSPYLCSWRWSGAEIKEIFGETSSQAAITFGYGNKAVNLNVTDSSGYSCTSTVNFFVDTLPAWRETKPE